jgi:hypothetical protein
VAIVWPCHASVDAYVRAGRAVEVPRPDCAACGAAMTFWAGYWRHVRVAGRCRKIFVPRARCGGCSVTHALLPAFVLSHRLDAVQAVGWVLEEVVDGPGGVRPAAQRAAVPYTTARGWVRRLGTRASELAVGFAALTVELGDGPAHPGGQARAWAMAAMRAAFQAATALPGWAALGRWRFLSCVSGGRLLAANTGWLYLVVGKRRFLPPVPATSRRDGG